MLGILLCMATMFHTVQKAENKFYIEAIVYSDFSATYALEHALEFLPPFDPMDEATINKNIKCLISELEASGLYSKVEANLKKTSPDSIHTKRDDLLILEVKVRLNRNVGDLAISSFTLDGLPEFDSERLQLALKKRKVHAGMYFLQYSYAELKKKIVEALEEIFPMDKPEFAPTIWFSFRPDGEKGVKLLITSKIPKC